MLSQRHTLMRAALRVLVGALITIPSALFSIPPCAAQAQGPASSHIGASRRTEGAPRTVFSHSDRLQKLVNDTATAAFDRFSKGGLAPDKLAITLIDLTDAASPASASYRGEEPAY